MRTITYMLSLVSLLKGISTLVLVDKKRYVHGINE